MVQKIVLVLVLLGIGLVSLLVPFRLGQKVNKLVVVSPTSRTNLEYPVTSNPLSLDHIFNTKRDWNGELPSDKLRTVIVTGDVIPARSVNFQATQRKDFTWPYQKTADLLKQGDITFINLEAPLIDNCPLTHEGMVFCGNSKNVEGLKFAGVDIANLANNHTGNYGIDAVISTEKLLTANGILSTGIEGSTIIDITGVKFAFLGFNDIEKFQPGISNMDETSMVSKITNAKKEADVVVAAIHWGTEYTAQPDDRQKTLGHYAIDAGADLVIGNHPHWIQPVEIYKNKLITYAHGNFIFDQEWSLKTKQGVIGKYIFYEDKLVDVEYIPVQLEYFGQPYVLTGIAKDKVLEDVKLQSQLLSPAN